MYPPTPYTLHRKPSTTEFRLCIPRDSGSNVIPRRARPGLAGLRPHTRLDGAEQTSPPLQRYLAHNNTPPHTGVTQNYGQAPPLGRFHAPRHRPTVGSYGGVCPYCRVTPVAEPEVLVLQSLPHGGRRGFRSPKILRCYVTKFKSHQAIESIA